MPKLYVLVGMIASGKSTFCEEKVMTNRAVVVNDDSIVTSLHAGWYGGYDPELMPLYKATEVHIARMALAMGRDVVIDKPNLCIRTRRKWIELARECRAECICVVFPMVGPHEHALRRWRADARGTTLEKWSEIARIHLAEYEPVTDDEPFDGLRVLQ